MFHLHKIRQIIVFVGLLYIGLPAVAAAPATGDDIKVINKTGEWIRLYKGNIKTHADDHNIMRGDDVHVIKGSDRKSFYKSPAIVDRISAELVGKPGTALPKSEIIDINAICEGPYTIIFMLNPARNKIDYEIPDVELKAGKEAIFPDPSARSTEYNLRVELGDLRAKLDRALAEVDAMRDRNAKLDRDMAELDRDCKARLEKLMAEFDAFRKELAG